MLRPLGSGRSSSMSSACCLPVASFSLRSFWAGSLPNPFDTGCVVYTDDPGVTADGLRLVRFLSYDAIERLGLVRDMLSSCGGSLAFAELDLRGLRHPVLLGARAGVDITAIVCVP